MTCVFPTPRPTNRYCRPWAKHAVDRDFDLKMLMRTILQSETYQRTSEPQAGERGRSVIFQSVLSSPLVSGSVARRDRPSIGWCPRRLLKLASTEPISKKRRSIRWARERFNWRTQPSCRVSSKRLDETNGTITCECERSNKPSIVQVLHINNGVTINDRPLVRQELRGEGDRLKKLTRRKLSTRRT